MSRNDDNTCKLKMFTTSHGIQRPVNSLKIKIVKLWSVMETV